MLKHRLKPGETVFIRGEIEIKNTGETNAHIGFIGGGEINFDVVEVSEKGLMSRALKGSGS